MGTRVIEFKFDDMAEGEEVEAVATVLFTDHDGNPMQIDLSAQHLLEYNGKMADYVKHGRPAELARRSTGGSGHTRTKASRARSQKIRTWAKKEGIQVSDRGRIPAEVEEQYEQALRRHRLSGA